MRIFACLIFAFITFTPGIALAGDGATVIFKSGTTVYLNNGFSQIDAGLRKFAEKNADNDFVRIQLGDAPFFINLGTVAIVCRDKCKSMVIVNPKESKR